MKLLATDEMIELLPATDATTSLAKRNFQKIISAANVREDWLDYSVKEGWLEKVDVHFNGVPHFQLWFKVEPDGRFYVDSAVSICNRPAFHALIAAIVKLAKKHNCCAIECRTKRPGLIRQLENFGFEVEAVVVSKKLL